MKRFVLLLAVCMTMAFSFAQSDEPETSKPSTDTEIVRRCSFLDIEGKYYDDVTVTMKSTSPDYFFTKKYRVYVTVQNKKGKKIYKKTFKNCYLYIFSNGQVQVGQPKFDQIVIRRAGEQWYGEIKEKEGVW